MDVDCPECHRPIPADKINVATDLAFCASCQQTFTLSDLVDPDAARQPAVNPARPPAGCAFQRTPNGFVLSAPTRRWALGSLLLLLALIWNGATLLFCLGFCLGLRATPQSTVVAGSATATASLTSELLILLVFGLPGLPVAVYAAVLLMSRVRVSVEGDEGQIVTGLGRLSRTRRFSWPAVRSVWRGWSFARDREMICITMKDEQLFEFGQWLTKERLRFVVGVLRQLLAARRAAQADD